MAALLGSRYLSRTLTRALIGALIGSWIAGMLALVGDLGMEVFVIVVVAGLPILGAILGWIAGGGHAYPNLALLGSVVGVVVFWSGASAYTTVQDFAVPYVVPMGLVAGGMVWVLRSGVFWLQRKGRSL